MSSVKSKTPGKAKRKTKGPHGRTKTAPFIETLYSIVNDPKTDAAVSWTPEGNGFDIHDTTAFQEILAKNFKSSVLASFVRQLHFYGWRKHDKSMRFQHPKFVRSHPEWLPLIHRKTSPVFSASQNARLNELVEEVSGLKRELKIVRDCNETLLKDAREAIHRASSAEERAARAEQLMEEAIDRISVLESSILNRVTTSSSSSGSASTLTSFSSSSSGRSIEFDRNHVGRDSKLDESRATPFMKDQDDEDFWEHLYGSVESDEALSQESPLESLPKSLLRNTSFGLTDGMHTSASSRRTLKRQRTSDGMKDASQNITPTDPFSQMYSAMAAAAVSTAAVNVEASSQNGTAQSAFLDIIGKAASGPPVPKSISNVPLSPEEIMKVYQLFLPTVMAQADSASRPSTGAGNLPVLVSNSVI